MTLHVGTGVEYDVTIGADGVAGAARFVRESLPQTRTLALVTDSNVDRLHGDSAARTLEASGARVERIVFPAGERSKTIETWAELVRSLAALRLSRRDAVVALGGGVTGDMAGFAAATYMRGIDFIQIPTTLLAMVDSSVGGKTAVDLPEGKNLVGAFHQPRAVFCDPAFLATLPEVWRLDGMGEVLKYAVLGDERLFARLESAPHAPIGEEDLARCIAMKRDIVARDEFESGERRLLNLGHTCGHAIEKLSDFSVSHGHAVATGVAMAARMSAAHGLLDAAEANRIVRLVAAMGFATETAFAATDLAAAIAMDKKTSGGCVAMVLPVRIGACELREVPLADIAQWLAS